MKFGFGAVCVADTVFTSDRVREECVAYLEHIPVQILHRRDTEACSFLVAREGHQVSLRLLRQLVEHLCLVCLTG